MQFNESRDGTYIGVKFSKDTLKAIHEYIKVNKIKNPVPIKDIHSTVIFSRVPFDIMEYFEIKSEKAFIKEFMILSGSLVMVLESDYLKELHNRIMREYPATYDFPEYIPHVTLSYGPKNSNDAPVPHEYYEKYHGIHKLPPFTYPVVIERVYVEDLNLEWKEEL